MGYIVVSRYVFYLQALTHPEEGNPKAGRRMRTGEQTHLRVYALRVPWGQRLARNAGYLDDAQFGGILGSVRGQSVQNMKDFVLGKGFSHPKLIVADVTERDLFSKPELAELLFHRWKQQMDRTTPARFSPDDLVHEENWSRDAGQVPLKSAPYKVNYPLHPFNTVWMRVNPTWPGRKIDTDNEAKILAGHMLDMPVQKELFQGMTGRRKQYNLEAITVLGVGYSLTYYQHGSGPVDGVTWLESIQRRVRPYLDKALRGASVEDLKGGQEWYALGAYQVPPSRERFTPTPSNRMKQFKTFRPGGGFYAAKLRDEEFAHRPLFVIKGRNVEDAQARADAMLFKMVHSSDLETSKRGLELEKKWHDAGRKMVSKEVILRLHRMQKNQ